MPKKRPWGTAKPKQELPSWFLEATPWWRDTIHPSEEGEYVDNWLEENNTSATASKEVEKGHSGKPTAKYSKGKGKEAKGVPNCTTGLGANGNLPIGATRATTPKGKKDAPTSQ